RRGSNAELSGYAVAPIVGEPEVRILSLLQPRPLTQHEREPPRTSGDSMKWAPIYTGSRLVAARQPAPRRLVAGFSIAGLAMLTACGAGATQSGINTAIPGHSRILPTLFTQTGAQKEFVVRPRQVVYTGDGTGFLEGLTWSSWTPRK